MVEQNQSSRSRIALLRGVTPESLAGQSRAAHVIFTVQKPIEKRPTSVVWTQVLPESRTLTIYAPFAKERCLEFKVYEEMLVSPKAWSDLTGLPPLVVWMGRGFAETHEVELALKEQLKTPLILVGSCLWLGDEFIVSPMGYRANESSWSTFAPAGGRLGLEFDHRPDVHRLTALKSLSHEALKTQTLYGAVDLLAQRISVTGSEAYYCHASGLKEAVTLVLMRMASGHSLRDVFIPRGSHAGWRRLIQNLGGRAVYHDGAVEGLASVEQISSHLPGFDWNSLVSAINQRSAVVPSDLINKI